MERVKTILRISAATILLIAVVVPMTIYVIVSTPWAQQKLCDVATTQLTELLGAQVRIGSVSYRPFNTISINTITIDGADGNHAASIGRLSARFEMWQFLRTQKLIFDYAVIDAPEIHLHKDTPDSPLNIAPIIERLKGDGKKKGSDFDLSISTIVIRRGRFTYDIRSAGRTPGRFNPSHIAVTNLEVYAYLRNAGKDYIDADIESLSLSEQSGLRIDKLAIDMLYAPGHISLREFSLDLPKSSITLNPVDLQFDKSTPIDKLLSVIPLTISPTTTAKISTSDFAWIEPKLANLNHTFNLDFLIETSQDELTIEKFDLNDGNGIGVNIAGRITDYTNPEYVSFNIGKLDISASGPQLANVISGINDKAAAWIEKTGQANIKGSIAGDIHGAQINLNAAAAGAAISFKGDVTTPDKYKSICFNGQAKITDLQINRLITAPDAGSATATLNGSGRIAPDELAIDGSLSIDALEWKGYTYHDITIDGEYDKRAATATISLASEDPAADLGFDLTADLGSVCKHIRLNGQIDTLIPSTLHLTADRPDYTLSGVIGADINATSIDDITGILALNDVTYASPDNTDVLKIKHFEITSEQGTKTQTLTITSDFLNGTIGGRIVPSTLIPTLRDMASHIVPALISHDEKTHLKLTDPTTCNNIDIALTIADAENISRFLNLPVQIIYPIDIQGNINTSGGTASLTMSAPYLQQGDKIIDSTVLGMTIDTAERSAGLYATTHTPTKKGPMTLVLGITGAENRFDTRVDWQIDRKIPLNGSFDLSTALSRGTEGGICAETTFNPGQLTFGDDVWSIGQSTVNWCDNILSVNHFNLSAGSQSIDIDGIASTSEDDEIEIKLNDITLASIFETLEIDKALIGGHATGTFHATQALSKLPKLSTQDLHVDDIAYNYCVLGDADIKAYWDNDKGSFHLDADITNPENQKSRIYGDIFAASESLDLYFEATHIKVGFMKPFMEAFTSDVDGFVSGNAHLFGTFKNIDMEGDVFAQDLKLKIDFTNTWYTATDSIHVRPGLINLEDITIRDVNGHTAKLNGWLRHDYFHNPVFDFRISDAHDFLSYDVTPKLSPDWYGTIYGNGSAAVVGKPGVVEISADMRTAPGSTFTFVLSDRLDAEQYSFITFNDVTPIEANEKDPVLDDIPQAVKEYQARMSATTLEEPSTYIMDIKVDITPEAQMCIVMDPVGGDRIKANGSGNLRMVYNSTENDLYMWGAYTLDRGSYNFTLQDIIIKDFTINQGSSITFRGDPYSAQLDLTAIYAVNANLSDLDESFTQDKDLNRTNVPVHALLKVTGDMRQPDISFDLAFPTLTSDTYRKVRSIISTDEMMNRQIIYLLALNRFYTPDYMASTTKGNELFSVASSTISSQLSSMLGKLSDNWSIAPNLRSDRGDFSDVEVDLALSSRLLNNRLLFNGNFGYRDKSLNTNQFIGDFDIEYLLNPRGTWRLKAYNRYNDQNYYVRTATTTQGVGIMFRHDFDSFRDLFRRHKKRDKAVQDSTNTPTDSIR